MIGGKQDISMAMFCSSGFNIHDSVDPKLLHKCGLLLTVTNLCMLLAYLNSYIMLVFSTHTLSQSLSVSLP